jgi:hypothetical protein
MRVYTVTKELAQFRVTRHWSTAKAILVSTTGNKKDAKWVPKSQVDLNGDYLTMPEWLAVKAGLIAKGRHR